uniref:Uncharacterized protein n=1 Tax=Marseillevirus sp. TaxID=2809551 RepID=A0AA96EPG7_9VIRU|nr:hypothetical protein MarFTMF_370 [Marseillevirus sp.]
MSITHNSGLSSFRAKPESDNESLRKLLQHLDKQTKESAEVLRNLTNAYQKISEGLNSLREEFYGVKEEVTSIEKKTRTLLNSSVGFKNSIQAVTERVSKLEEPTNFENSLGKVEAVVEGLLEEKFPELEKRLGEIEDALSRPVEEKPKPTRSRKKD